MKVLVLSHISELVGGAEKSLLDLFDIWVKKYNVQPEFILRSPIGTLGDELKKRNWKLYEVDYTFWSESNPPKDAESKRKKSIKNTKAIIEIENIIQNTKPDLVFTNSVVCPWAAIAAYNKNLPHVWFVREYGDLDHKRIFDISREKTWDDVDILSSLVVTNSLGLAKHLKKYMPAEKVTTLYHPFNIEEIIKKSKVKVLYPYISKDSLKLILTAGSLTTSKGVAEAVEAVGIMNMEGFEVEICLVGRPDNKDYIKIVEGIIDKYAIKQKVHFVGWQKNPLAYVALADVGIMASRMEAFGRVTFEYLSIGKPVMGTNSGGTPEMVIDGENGYLYDWGDVKSLVKGLENYAKDKKLLKKHSENASEKSRQLMLTKYNVDNLFRSLEVAVKTKSNKTHKLNYETELADYAQLRKSMTKSNVMKNKLKKKTHNQYRRARTLARKVIKGY